MVYVEITDLMRLIIMKKFFFTFFVLAGFLSCKAQSKGSISLYGYKQAVLPGTIPKGVTDENGKEVEIEYKPRYNYFIYTASNARIYPVEIWINGQAYAVKTNEISQTPVEHFNPTGSPENGEKTILVPKTSKKVIQITLAPSISTQNAKAKTLSDTNELVLIYKQNGRSYYSSLKKIKELEAVAMY